MGINYKLKDFAALEPEIVNKTGTKKTLKEIEEERKTNRQAISECTTKIMNTASFRKLAGKTQVILSLSGPDVRTRLTHTIEVAKIAKDICIRLGLNAELAEAMALAHDIGHTPFGHVGERTLTEIMCGCDTLKKKVRDCDFANSGFKHNIQSFRVLNDIECVHNNGNHSEIWPLIFWGSPAHTKLTWAKDYSGMDNEILISPKHCDWVYVCHHDDKKKCKRNIQIKKEKSKLNNNEICKPWYCANLPIIDEENKVKEEHLYNGETTREYLKREPIKKIYLPYIYCSHKCYLSKLWKYKIDKKDTHKTYPYFFDHPFPNSFYIDSFHRYFNDISSFVTLEALIVSQADEIAQHQQDLEDGILKELLPFEQARKNVEDLVENFYKEDKEDKIKETTKDKIKEMTKEVIGAKKLNNLPKNYSLKKIFEYITTSEELGKFLTIFYINIIVDQTLQNVNKWGKEDAEKKDINIYSLMNILHSMIDNVDKKTEWIITELKSYKKNEDILSISEATLWKPFYKKINTERAYLYLLSFDHLEQFTKRFDFKRKEKMIDILSECKNCLNRKAKEFTYSQKDKFKELIERFERIDISRKNQYIFAYNFIKTLDSLRNFLMDRYEKQSNDFFNMKRKEDKRYWQTIGWLNLNSFYPLLQIFKQIDENKKELNSIADLKDFETDIDKNFKPKEHAKRTFKAWKKILNSDANKVLSNLVVFFDKETQENRKKACEDFEDGLRNTILKSEAVEKNDGKAKYILKRLFSAYIDNSHQLSDSGLKNILNSLIDKNKFQKLIKNEKKIFKTILNELEETMILENNKVHEILKHNFPKIIKNKDQFDTLKQGCSNEVRASLDKREKLYKYFNKIKAKQKKIEENFNSEGDEEKTDIQTALRELRAILDNAILNAIPYWDSILTRAICDHIASLTDQEAVTEYEKLYTGIMELT